MLAKSQADRLNLLPKSLRTKAVNQQSLLLAGWSACAALIIIGIPFQLWRAHANAARFEMISKYVEPIHRQLAEVEKISNLSTSADERIVLSREFLASKVIWTGALKELSLLIPKTVWLTSFSMKSGLKGPYIEVLGSASSQDKIAGFLSSLEDSYYFRAVTLKKSEKILTVSPDLYKFELDIVLPQLVAGGAHEKAK